MAPTARSGIGTSALTVMIDAGTSEMALAIPDGQTFEQWLAMGRQLNAGAKVLNWWIGDWWAAGSHRYGERARAAAENLFGHEFQTLMNMASVCRSFEASRRREGLSFTHHAEVAVLSAEAADELLDAAVRDGLTKRELRTRVRALRGQSTPSMSEDDPVYAGARRIQYAWNREAAEARATFLTIAQGAELGVVDL